MKTMNTVTIEREDFKRMKLMLDVYFLMHYDGASEKMKALMSKLDRYAEVLDVTEGDIDLTKIE